jgi:ribosomal protein S18 acetylase RimI-like enzyme
MQAEVEREGFNVAGDRRGVLGERGCAGCLKRFNGESQLAGSALGAEAMGKLAPLAGAGFKSHSAQGFGRGEVERHAQLRGGVAKQPALQRRGQRGQSGDVESQDIRGGAPAPANGLAGEQDLRRHAGQLRLPPGFLIAGQLSHLAQVLAEARVPGFELRQEFVTDAVAGEGWVLIRGVVAPWLVQGLQIRFDLRASRGQERAEDAALGKFNDWMNAAQAFGPGAAQEFSKNRLGLVVESVGGGDCIERCCEEKLAKPLVPEAARGFFNRLACLGGCGRNVDAGFVEGDFELRREAADEVEVGIGLGAAEAVMQMRGVQHQPQLPGLLVKRAQQRHRIRAAGKADGDPQPRIKVSRIEGQRDGQLRTHVKMIRVWPALQPEGSRYTAEMLEIRVATAEDAALIAAQRRAMFAEMGTAPANVLDAMTGHFKLWVARMIGKGTYLGFIAMEDGRPAAGAGLMILDWPPHPFDPAGEHRGYLLNVYVEPEYRRRGVAQALVDRCMDEGRRRGMRVIALHSSDAGRSIYEKLGFRATSEMFHLEPGLTDEGLETEGL